VVGDGLAHHDVLRAGDFVHIPAGVPHLSGNPSATEPTVAVVARTDPNEQESVVLLPPRPRARGVVMAPSSSPPTR
jgi:uncharacterized RmlC-like cupin family protein